MSELFGGFYHCHHCSNEFKILKDEDLECPFCGSTSIEVFEFFSESSNADEDLE
jgi:rRNA maturation endonuclease Nob1